ncbi:MAG: heme anaerobic degradation radical SAM methyltransferase ChuW/HutW [Sporomusaceae bacterium]|nr:heme anaerobic degradation radical SAM methyltransferase ChuW/HutW [Sporomusaceae bacterium]
MTGRLNRLFAAMRPEQVDLLVGMETGDPLAAAFAGKRVLHAGLRGGAIMPSDWQPLWQRLMDAPPPPGKRVAYVHIPFCLHRCLYCGFFQNVSSHEQENAYIDRLVREIEAGCRERYVAGGRIQAVFIGGGTPSALSAANAARLLAAIRRLPLANDYELTLEARVHDLVPEKMEAWLDNGVNRISIGVQSFDTQVRQAVGRLDAGDIVLERLRQLSAYDQAAVIIDLMYGLPYQDRQVWQRDLALLGEAAIDGWDLYQLNIYEHSDLRKAIDAGRLPPAATVAEQARMFAAAETLLAENPFFSRLNVCHWSKTNRERNMYNTLTKSGNAVIPFGSGAGGSVGGISLSLDRSLQSYLNRIDQGEKPIVAMRQPHTIQELQNAVLSQIRQGHLSLEALAAQFGHEVMELEPLLKTWEARGLLQRGAVAARLTVAGQFWYMNIAQSVLECLHALLTGTQLQPKMA